MVGIVSFGAYVPHTRLSRNEIARATGHRSMGGERTGANHDEDSVTMAVSAALNCIEGVERDQIDAVFFASTTAPYKEKQSASLVAAALDLRRDVAVSDFGNSLRAGTNALRAALNAVASGAASLALVTAADCRLGQSGSASEQDFGDGAAAILVGNKHVAVNIVGSHTHTDEFMDQWRYQNDDFVRSWETRFALEHGYFVNMKESVAKLMAKAGLKPKDFTRAVYYSPDRRSHSTLAQSLGFDAKTQLQDPLYDRMGSTGCAFALMLLVAALEEAGPEQRLLLVSYGDGCDAFSLMTTQNIARTKGHKALKHQLGATTKLVDYETYQRFRQLISSEITRAPAVPLSVPVLWRDRAEIVSLRGQRCLNCGKIEFPQQRVCGFCQSKDKFEEIRLSDKRAAVFTYTIDHLAPTINPPIIRCALNFEGGGRILTIMTDCDPAKIAIDMPVEMTFRKQFDANDIGVHTYAWKCKPETN